MKVAANNKYCCCLPNKPFVRIALLTVVGIAAFVAIRHVAQHFEAYKATARSFIDQGEAAKPVKEIVGTTPTVKSGFFKNTRFTAHYIRGVHY